MSMPSTLSHGTTDLRTGSLCLRWMRSSGSNDIDVGIFMSYIGLFSHYQFDNRVYQPSYVSSNTPRFFNGMRIQIFPSDKLKPPVSANVRSLIGFGRVCGPYDFFTEHLRHFYGRSATLGIRPAYPVRSWTSRNGYSGQGETMRIPIHNIIASDGLPLCGFRSRSWKTVGKGIQQSESYLFRSHRRTGDSARIAES